MLTNTTLYSNVSWNLSKTLTGLTPATQVGGFAFSLANLNLATWNAVYVAVPTIAASSSTTIDLTSVADLLGTSLVFTKVKAIQVQPTGANITVAPAASNGLVWMGTITVKNGGLFCWSESISDTGTVVDSTHKSLTFTNLSASVSVAVSIYLLGSTL